MDQLLLLLLLLGSSGLQAAGQHSSTEPDGVRLVGGDSRCAGTLELKHEGEWRPVGDSHWTLTKEATACRQLDCGSAVSVRWNVMSSDRPVWVISSACAQSGSALKNCASAGSSSSIVDVHCSDSIRLVDGTSLCSGRLEVRSDQSNQSWSSVCEAAFDQQDAEVVCRELGCGAPSVLQGALYGEVEAPMWTKEFQCGGDESALLDCRSSSSDRNTCSPGRAAGLTCSEPVRLEGGASRCVGTLEVKQDGEWRPVVNYDIQMKDVVVLCRQLDCGSAVSTTWKEVSTLRPMWWISSDCVQSGSALRECGAPWPFHLSLVLNCSDLHQPNISASSSMDGVSEAQQQGQLQVFKGSNFTISCSIQPQHPGGSFQLSFTSSSSTISYTQPAVNHSADFLFPAAEPAHQGNYSCVYHVHVFSHDFSSESRQLSVSVSDLHQPNISASSSMDGVSEAQQQGQLQVFKGSNFTISCSIQPQHPGGSFQLSFTSSSSTISYTQPAVNHSADFLFPAAEPAHQGNYSCVYHVHVFSHDFSSESRQLSVSVSDVSGPAPFVIRAVVLPPTFLLLIAALCFFQRQATRGQKPNRQEDMEMDDYHVPAEEAQARL